VNTHPALRDRFAAAALPGVLAVAVELARTKSEVLAGEDLRSQTKPLGWQLSEEIQYLDLLLAETQPLPTPVRIA
jgi:hypothetical protein